MGWFVMGETTGDLLSSSQEEPIEIRKNLKSGVNRANNGQDTAIYKLEN